MSKLSIIIPYYNAEPFTSELLDALAPQITDEVEVIIVDDGSKVPFKTSYKWAKVVRKKNGGCATARNKGLDLAQGEYISFVDADDLVAEYFVAEILKKAEKQFDVCDLSWKSLTTEGKQHDHLLTSDIDRLPNPSVCTRVFRRAFIGDIRFNELKDSTEDEDFSRKVGYLMPGSDIVHVSICSYMYFYRTAVDNSKIKRYKQGIMKTKRITYYYHHVTRDMMWLLEEIKKEDERNEVWLLTNQCDIPELRRYCQVSRPKMIWTHYLRGEKYSKCIVIDIPLKVDVVMYCEYANKVGGISTFIYNWCQMFKDQYDILVLYDRFDDIQVQRLSKIVKCKKNDKSVPIYCKTLILNRLTDKIPPNVWSKKTVQVCHACTQIHYRIPQGRDYLVNVSEAAKASWGDESKDGIVIHNPSYVDVKKSLLLVSATRIGAPDKGENDNRYIKLAKKLNNAGIPFVWLNFSDKPLKNPPANFINMDARLNVQDFIARADYLVQLSDVEAYSYSILEALTNNTPVICTPIPSAFEQGVKDGENAHILPYNMDFDVHSLLTVPKFRYNYDNQTIKRQWTKILNAKPKKKEYQKPSDVQNASVTSEATGKIARCKVLVNYRDMQLNQRIQKRTEMRLPLSRAFDLSAKGIVEILDIVEG